LRIEIAARAALAVAAVASEVDISFTDSKRQ